MSKKRNKAARKKSPRKHLSTGSSPARLDNVEESWEDAYEQPEVQQPVASTGGGALGKMRATMQGKQREGQERGFFQRKRSVSELMLWLGGASGLIYLVLHLLYGNPES